MLIPSHFPNPTKNGQNMTKPYKTSNALYDPSGSNNRSFSKWEITRVEVFFEVRELPQEQDFLNHLLEKKDVCRCCLLCNVNLGQTKEGYHYQLVNRTPTSMISNWYQNMSNPGGASSFHIVKKLGKCRCLSAHQSCLLFMSAETFMGWWYISCQCWGDVTPPKCSWSIFVKYLVVVYICLISYRSRCIILILCATTFWHVVCKSKLYHLIS